MLKFIQSPWPWHLAGALIGLMVPALLLMGNKRFGISANLRHICAACVPTRLPFFKYDWKREAWNLYFVLGTLLGAFLATKFLGNPAPLVIAEATLQDLQELNLVTDQELMPASIFSLERLFTPKGLVFIVLGGFLVGFGTRYASGCTSGHAIMGLSTLQWPSLVATCSFMAGGFAMVHLIFPWLLRIL